MASANTSPFVQVGSIARSHGLKGELKILFDIGNPDQIKQIELVYLQNSRGDFFPCRIKNLRLDDKESRLTFFVHFENIADRSAAESVRGKRVFVENDKALLLSDETNVEETFIDFEVVDEKNQHKGLVIDELDNGAQLVIVVATTSGSLMIPLVDQFVDAIDESESVVRCKNLDLLEG